MQDQLSQTEGLAAVGSGDLLGRLMSPLLS
jgi:hypothetical protein